MSKSDNTLFLTIDQGGHASRTLIIDKQGRIIAKASHEISATRSSHGFSEYNAEEIISSIQHTIESAFSQALDSCKHSCSTDLRIVSAGLATQRSNIICWNKLTGEALSPVISWQDHRAQQWTQLFVTDKDLIRERTGLPLSSHYGAGKLRWCLTEIAEVQQALDENQLALGPMASFIAFRLFTERPILCDPGNASRTQLMDIETLDWCDELLTLFDIPRQTLPQCVRTRSNFGTLKLGNMTVPVSIMTGDQCAAFYAHGQPDEKTASITLGTGAFIQQAVTQCHHQKNLLSSVVYADNQHTQYCIEATINGAGSALEIIAETLGLSDYQEKLSGWLTHCDNPPLFLNGIGGLGTPYFIADFDSRFIGGGDKENKMVAVIESIIFLIMSNLDIMKKQAIPPQQIIIGGGLSQLDGLCQRLADISLLPVKRTSISETTCFGLAYLLSDNTLNTQHEQTLFASKANSLLLNRYLRWQQAMSEAIDD